MAFLFSRRGHRGDLLRGEPRVRPGAAGRRRRALQARAYHLRRAERHHGDGCGYRSISRRFHAMRHDKQAGHLPRQAQDAEKETWIKDGVHLLPPAQMRL